MAPRTPPHRSRRAIRARSRRVAAAVLLLAAAGVAAAVVAQRPSPPSRPAVAAATPSPSATATDTPTPAPREDQTPPPHAEAVPVAAGPAVVVPILYYHYLRVDTNPADKVGFKLSVTPANFAQQMALLHAEGAHTLTLAQVMDALVAHRPLPSHPVVLTFDDGHDSFATRGVPVLQQYGFTATAFVVPGFLGQTSYMTVGQLQQVAAAGMVVGAHTMHHVDLAAEPVAVARAEIDQSRTVLQQLTGQTVDDFAYPYGAFTGTTVALVQQAGFRDACSTMWGVQQTLAGRFAMRREEVTGYDSLASFAVKALLPVPRGGVPSAAPPPGGTPAPSGAVAYAQPAWTGDSRGPRPA